MEKIDFDGVTLHRWSCGSSTYLVRPELGARLMNWNLRMADGSVRDVIHWPENADYGKFAEVQGVWHYSCCTETHAGYPKRS